MFELITTFFTKYLTSLVVAGAAIFGLNSWRKRAKAEEELEDTRDEAQELKAHLDKTTQALEDAQTEKNQLTQQLKIHEKAAAVPLPDRSVNFSGATEFLRPKNGSNEADSSSKDKPAVIPSKRKSSRRTKRRMR